MLHLDLFSGIGGFAYAADQVWDGVEHIFCEVDPFCRQVLDKHWPGSEIIDDIKKFNTNTWSKRLEGYEPRTKAKRQSRELDISRENQEQRPFILTGGFPCQPFSAAGVRRGTADERYLWPEMLRVIRLTQPTWVIAENVRGLLTWESGLVFQQICSDLETSGYEVQPFIIPAVAVNAPHRRDRIWWVAHDSSGDRRQGQPPATKKENRQQGLQQRGELARRPKRPNSLQQTSKNPISKQGRGRYENSRQILGRQSSKIQDQRPSWESNWFEIATELCSLDDGLPAKLGGTTISKSRHRAEQLKGYGNAIVPQVAIEIMRGINLSLEDTKSGSYTSKKGTT